MKIADVYSLYVVSALTLLPEKMQSIEAQAMLLAIGLQESGLKHRKQIRGPAKGYWQFELIGVQGVLEGVATEKHSKPLLERLDYPWNPDAVHQAIQFDGILAAAMARLTLYQYPGSLPGMSGVDEGWKQYIKTWRPGKPHADRWPANFNQAWCLLRQGA